MNLTNGLEIHCDADLPARSGLGSSSSFVVGLLHALYACKGKRVSQEFLAQEAIRIEQDVLCENVGSQDQIAAAVGGFNIIKFLPGGGFKVEPLVLPKVRRQLLNDHLMLFFTGFSRIASQVAKSQIDNIDSKTKELTQMRKMVDNALDILYDERPITQFGELLHDGWMLKRSLSDQVSNPAIDTLYENARRAGSIGGKLLGAGGGGFMLLFVPPEKQAQVRKVMADLIHVPFAFESTGSSIVYFRV
jgi:D-glycero-alpha-D-manno-heptose-7-phosphate kinase